MTLVATLAPNVEQGDVLVQSFSGSDLTHFDCVAYRGNDPDWSSWDCWYYDGAYYLDGTGYSDSRQSVITVDIDPNVVLSMYPLNLGPNIELIHLTCLGTLSTELYADLR